MRVRLTRHIRLSRSSHGGSRPTLCGFPVSETRRNAPGPTCRFPPSSHSCHDASPRHHCSAMAAGPPPLPRERRRWHTTLSLIGSPLAAPEQTIPTNRSAPCDTSCPVHVPNRRRIGRPCNATGQHSNGTRGDQTPFTASAAASGNQSAASVHRRLLRKDMQDDMGQPVQPRQRGVWSFAPRIHLTSSPEFGFSEPGVPPTSPKPTFRQLGQTPDPSEENPDNILSCVQPILRISDRSRYSSRRLRRHTRVPFRKKTPRTRTTPEETPPRSTERRYDRTHADRPLVWAAIPFRKDTVRACAPKGSRIHTDEQRIPVGLA